MDIKIYDITYINENGIYSSISCTSYSLDNIKKTLIENGSKILDTVERIQNCKAKSKEIDKINKIQKTKYYNAQLSLLHSKLNQNTITENEFNRELEILERLNKQCKTDIELEVRFMEDINKKKTNNIS